MQLRTGLGLCNIYLAVMANLVNVVRAVNENRPTDLLVRHLQLLPGVVIDFDNRVQEK